MLKFGISPIKVNYHNWLQNHSTNKGLKYCEHFNNVVYKKVKVKEIIFLLALEILRFFQFKNIPL